MLNPLADYVSAHLADPTPITVIFTKTDGTERRMTCTTNHLLIPVDKLPDSAVSTYTPSESVIRAFDLEKNAWRSFRRDSILRVETIQEISWLKPIAAEITPKIVDISDL